MRDPVKEEVELIFDEQDELIQNKTIRGCSGFSEAYFTAGIERDFHDIEWKGRAGLGLRPVRNL